MNSSHCKYLAFLTTASLGFVSVASAFQNTIYNASAEHGFQAPQSVVTADFNEDGNQDAVVGGWGSPFIRLYRGAGTGGFSSFTDTPIPFFGIFLTWSPIRLATADFNNDSHVDLAVSSGSGDLFVLLNDGAGNLNIAYSKNDQFRGVALAVGDVNEDGKLDIVRQTLVFGGVVAIHLGDGAGGFSDPTYIIADIGVDAGAVTLADFNGDQHLDIASLGSSKLRILLGDGQGNFTLSPLYLPSFSSFHGLAAADFNLSGDIDLMVTGNLQDFFVNNGSGVFTSQAVGLFPLASVSAADLNHDGIADVSGNGTLPIGSGFATFINQGGGTLQFKHSTAVSAVGMAVGDMNNDTHPDFAYISGFYDVGIVATDGNGNFSNRAVLPLTGMPKQVQVGDLNGDDRPDIITYSLDDLTDVYTFLNNGPAPFSSGGTEAVPSNTGGFDVADFTGDGILDYVAARNSVHQIQVGAGAGNGTFSVPVIFNDRPNTVTLAAGDLDGDNDNDIVTIQSNGTAALQFNNGSGAFAIGGLLNINNLPNDVKIADFNIDGRLDICISNSQPSRVTVVLGSLSGGFLTPRKFALAAAPSTLQIGDLNSDGAADLLVGSTAGTVSVFLGNYLSVFAPEVTYSITSSFTPTVTSLAIGDANGDGNPEVAALQTAAQRMVIFRGDGTGALIGYTGIATATQPTSVAFGDFDGDGHDDFVTLNNGSVSVVTNQIP